MKSDLVDLTVRCKAITERAMLVSNSDDEDAKSVWLPLSLIEVEAKEGNIQPGVVVVVTCPGWLATEKELV